MLHHCYRKCCSVVTKNAALEITENAAFLFTVYNYRRIFYRLKSPDFVRKVGGYAPDYPNPVKNGEKFFIQKTLHPALELCFFNLKSFSRLASGLFIFEKMDVENLIAIFERKLTLQRYSDSSIKNYSSSVRSFLQVAESGLINPTN